MNLTVSLGPQMSDQSPTQPTEEEFERFLDALIRVDPEGIPKKVGRPPRKAAPKKEQERDTPK